MVYFAITSMRMKREKEITISLSKTVIVTKYTKRFKTKTKPRSSETRRRLKNDRVLREPNRCSREPVQMFLLRSYHLYSREIAKTSEINLMRSKRGAKS